MQNTLLEEGTVEVKASTLPSPVPVMGWPGSAALSPVPYEQLTPRLHGLLEARVRRLGYLGGFFAAAARQPVALGHFIEYTETLTETLPDDLVQVVALRTATLTGNEYELVQHRRLAAKQGMTPGWISAAEAGEGSELAARHLATAALVDACVAHDGAGSRLSFARLVHLQGPDESMAVLMMLGRYVAHAAISNAVGLEANLPSTS